MMLREHSNRVRPQRAHSLTMATLQALGCFGNLLPALRKILQTENSKVSGAGGGRLCFTGAEWGARLRFPLGMVGVRRRWGEVVAVATWRMEACCCWPRAEGGRTPMLTAACCRCLLDSDLCLWIASCSARLDSRIRFLTLLVVLVVLKK